MRKKVGIMTLYHNSYNYGGLLQAYALREFVENLGYDCEQIDFDYGVSFKDKWEKLLLASPVEVVKVINRKRKYYRNKRKQASVILTEEETECQRLSKERCTLFREKISHSEPYKPNDLYVSGSKYDCYICGSDQIWNPYWFHKAYFLDFVSENRRRIAYSASIGRSYLEKYEKKQMEPLLAKLDAISMREIDGQKLVEQIGNIESEVVVDPVFLRNREEWDKLQSDFTYSGEYLFCYFLTKEDQTQNIEELKKTTNLPILCLYKNILYQYNQKGNEIEKKCVRAGIGPAEFVGLCKSATAVITDSFHATVFSVIYERQFVVVKRYSDEEKESTNARIKDLLQIIDLDNRSINSFCIKNILSIIAKKIDYETVKIKVKSNVDKSKKWLQEELIL